MPSLPKLFSFGSQREAMSWLDEDDETAGNDGAVLKGLPAGAIENGVDGQPARAGAAFLDEAYSGAPADDSYGEEGDDDDLPPMVHPHSKTHTQNESSLWLQTDSHQSPNLPCPFDHESDGAEDDGLANSDEEEISMQHPRPMFRLASTVSGIPVRPAASSASVAPSVSTRPARLPLEGTESFAHDQLETLLETYQEEAAPIGEVASASTVINRAAAQAIEKDISTQGDEQHYARVAEEGNDGQQCTADAGMQMEGAEQEREGGNSPVEGPEHEMDPESRERRKQAIKYLESIPVTLLSQLAGTLELEALEAASLVEIEIAARPEDPDALPASESQAATESKKTGALQRKRQAIKEHQAEFAEKRSEDWGVALPMLDRATGESKFFRYPQKGGDPALTLARLMRVADLMHEALVTGQSQTKRDIYYKDTELFFGRQSVVDDLVDTLVASANLRRADFSVGATAKGLVAAAGVEIGVRGSGSINLSSGRGCLIPPVGNIVQVNMEFPVDWVLVVEKDAVFQALCTPELLEHQRLGRGMLVTGKGYPDLYTRQFLNMIAEQLPDCKIFALMDADPHGLHILSVYMHGSKTGQFAPDTVELALGDRLIWLGFKATDWQARGFQADNLSQLTAREVTFAYKLIREHAGMPDEWRQQLCHLLHTLRKAEIELLTEPSGKTVQAPRSREAHATIATESLPRAVCPLLQYLEGKMAPYLA